MRNPHDIIIRPVITEHSMESAADKCYSFRVASDSNKIEIRAAVEKAFGVKVQSVNTINMPAKKKRMGVHLGTRPAWKKAVVRLKPESKPIEFFEGMV